MYGANSIDLKFHPYHNIVTKIKYRDKWIKKQENKKSRGCQPTAFVTRFNVKVNCPLF